MLEEFWRMQGGVVTSFSDLLTFVEAISNIASRPPSDPAGEGDKRDAERYRALRAWHDSPNIPEFNLDEGADALIEAKDKALSIPPVAVVEGRLLQELLAVTKHTVWMWNEREVSGHMESMIGELRAKIGDIEFELSHPLSSSKGGKT